MANMVDKITSASVDNVAETERTAMMVVTIMMTSINGISALKSARTASPNALFNIDVPVR